MNKVNLASTTKSFLYSKKLKNKIKQYFYNNKDMSNTRNKSTERCSKFYTENYKILLTYIFK